MRIELVSLGPTWRTLMAALMLAVPFHEPALHLFIFFAMVPWFFELERKVNYKFKLVQTTWLSLLASGFVLFWAIPSLKNTYHLSWGLSAIFAFFFFAFNQLQFYLFAGLLIFSTRFSRLLPGRGVYRCFIFALFYTSFDGLVPKLFSGTLGYALYGSELLKQAADLGGAHLLTFAIFVTNLLIYEILLVRKGQAGRRRWLKPSMTIILVIGSLLGYGEYCQRRYAQGNLQSLQTLSALVVQGNTPHDLKEAALNDDHGAQRKVVDHYLEISGQANQKYPTADFMVWPETAYPLAFGSRSSPFGNEMDDRLIGFVRKINKPLIFGGFSQDQGKGLPFNSIVILRPSGQSQVYRKNILLPFEEYVPILGDISFLKGAFGNQNRRSPDLRLLELPAKGEIFRMIPVICYESMFTGQLARGARQAGNFIINLTEDTWFDSAFEARLHLRASTFGSIETRHFALRATGSGISALVDPLGEIHNSSNPATEAFINYQVPTLEKPITLTAAWGDWFSRWSGVAALILTITWSFIKKRGRDAIPST